MNKLTLQCTTLKLTLVVLALAFLFFTSASIAHAATLRLAPATGVYTTGTAFTAQIIINTTGSSINAAEGRLTFNPKELSVVSVSRSSSIFNLWTEEPAFSNTAGTITFGGGSPNGYLGSNGTVMSITFRPLNAGTPKVVFSSGSVLAADGLGTNILTSMDGASYTVTAPAVNPEPEYITPDNAPGTPHITSTTHPDPEGWYKAKTAELSWELPPDVTAIRTLFDENSGTIPTKLYDTPISSITIEDLEDGISYFHLQFRNEHGWGKVAHYRIAVDTKSPESFQISQPENQDKSSPTQTLIFSINDISPIVRYLIQLDGDEPIEFEDKDQKMTYDLTNIEPGHHSVVVEAYDSAGNSLVSSYSFDVFSFEKPIFTEFPNRINEGVIPVIRGTTKPNSEVLISISKVGSDIAQYSVRSNEKGIFTFIPDSSFSLGVYNVYAIATDELGAKSDPSETMRMLVEQPGYIRIGSIMVSALSVIVPLIALVVLFILGSYYVWRRFVFWRQKLRKETSEIGTQLAHEFDEITKNLNKQVLILRKARHGKLTKGEEAMIDQILHDIKSARARIQKEIKDVKDVIE